MKEKINQNLFIASAISVLISAALYISLPEIMKYIFAVGAAGMAISRLNLRYDTTNVRIKRLYRIQKVASLLIVGASYFMFKANNQWVLLLLIAAILELYTNTILSKLEQ